MPSDHNREGDFLRLFEELDGPGYYWPNDDVTPFPLVEVSECYAHLKTAVEALFGCPLRGGVGHPQDAMFHGMIWLPKMDGSVGQDPCIITSNFGRLATIQDEDKIRKDIRECIQNTIQESGYVYVPAAVLLELKSKSSTTGLNWFTRFFSFD